MDLLTPFTWLLASSMTVSPPKVVSTPSAVAMAAAADFTALIK